MTQTMMETLAEMERERVALMEDLGRLAERQKNLQKEMRTIEKRHRDIARDLEEYTFPEHRELSHEDVDCGAAAPTSTWPTPSPAIRTVTSLARRSGSPGCTRESSDTSSTTVIYSATATATTPSWISR